MALVRRQNTGEWPAQRGHDGKTDFKSIDQYIAAQPAAVQSVLSEVREILRASIQGAEEAISYQIPAFKLKGRTVIYFAGWKSHFSIYPLTEHLVEAFRDELAPYKLSKGTVRFPLSKPVPKALIERIAKFMALEARKKPSSAA